jgi:hypothetical protein
MRGNLEASRGFFSKAKKSPFKIRLLKAKPWASPKPTRGMIPLDPH